MKTKPITFWLTYEEKVGVRRTQYRAQIFCDDELVWTAPDWRFTEVKAQKDADTEFRLRRMYYLQVPLASIPWEP